MAFDTPDLRTLITRSQADIEAELPGENAKLRRSNLNVLARVMAGMAHGFFAFIREFLAQCLPWSKGFLLRQWAEIWGVFTLAATPAQRQVVLTGTEGSVIDSDTSLQATDGREYVTLSPVTIASGSAVATVIAVVAGAAGNINPGTVLSLVNPIDGVASTAAVGASGAIDGNDAESMDSLYSRYLQRVQNPPGGGNDEDYKRWAREVAGVTRVWVYSGLDGEDTVQVFFVRDDDMTSIIPDTTEVAAVDAYIRAPSRKPVAASVGIYAPVAKVINFTIGPTPNTPEVKAAIEQELRDLIKREATLGGTLLRTHMTEAISLAQGENDHNMTVPAGNVICASNELAMFGAITWL